MSGVFITATDTGVGKTFVACALLRAAVRRGLRVSAIKPCETGDGDDGSQLIAACGRPIDEALARPYRFRFPASPEAAAQDVGATIDVTRIEAAYAELARDVDIAVVEGAGGLLVPIAPGVLMADLIARLKLPVVIVARASLGTVNHTLLTIEAARARQLQVLGVILTHSTDSRGADENTNPGAIATRGRTHILGALPYVADATNPSSIDEAFERFVLLDDLFRLIQTQPRNL
jgi:dethiobiotin synthetase